MLTRSALPSADDKRHKLHMWNSCPLPHTLLGTESNRAAPHIAMQICYLAPSNQLFKLMRNGTLIEERAMGWSSQSRGLRRIIGMRGHPPSHSALCLSLPLNASHVCFHTTLLFCVIFHYFSRTSFHTSFQQLMPENVFNLPAQNWRFNLAGWGCLRQLSEIHC